MELLHYLILESAIRVGNQLSMFKKYNVYFVALCLYHLVSLSYNTWMNSHFILAKIPKVNSLCLLVQRIGTYVSPKLEK
jgi:hypothetical protein